MALKKNATYNFNTNLLKASEGKDIESVIKQWEIIYEEKREHQDGLCICQKKVKNIIYMYNINTTNTIIVGSSCRKKFNMENNKISNKILKVLFTPFYISNAEFKISSNWFSICIIFFNNYFKFF
jgi:hypothetical protein